MSTVDLPGQHWRPAAPVADMRTLLGDPRPGAGPGPGAPVVEVADAAGLAAYARLRHEAFVLGQGLFDRSDRDAVDEDPRTVVLLARLPDGTGGASVVGGVRLGPAGLGRDLAWWRGGRLVVAPGTPGRVGSALVRAAVAHAQSAGVLRFDATVQVEHRALFERLGWTVRREVVVAGRPHLLALAPTDRVEALVRATKADLGGLLAGLVHDAGGPDGAGFLGDDGAPVPGTDVVVACDAIVPSMVERDPTWAGWCSVLVNVNDLAATGAEPVGLMDAVGARDRSFATRVLAGVRAASEAYGVPVLGGHTQLGVPASLCVTALGRTSHPVPGGGGRPGHDVRLTADLRGGWREGHTGRQWDSTTGSTPAELAAMTGAVGRARPAAAKDVSMAGVVGTLGMMAEAGGCGAVLDVASVPAPATAATGDWLTCFPGFAMLTADVVGRPALEAGPAVGAVCGRLEAAPGVRLRWPDGELTTAVAGPVTRMGPA